MQVNIPLVVLTTVVVSAAVVVVASAVVVVSAAVVVASVVDAVIKCNKCKKIHYHVVQQILAKVDKSYCR